mmetsp:Transcript_119757/g.310563  ORF Transcript_119757/g.310563 Transcript_119757/m.310563 type:complete len:242 (+) Transcript_119757:241-966(+)
MAPGTSPVLKGSISMSPRHPSKRRGFGQPIAQAGARHAAHRGGRDLSNTAGKNTFLTVAADRGVRSLTPQDVPAWLQKASFGGPRRPRRRHRSVRALPWHWPRRHRPGPRAEAARRALRGGGPGGHRRRPGKRARPCRLCAARTRPSFAGGRPCGCTAEGRCCRYTRILAGPAVTAVALRRCRGPLAWRRRRRGPPRSRKGGGRLRKSALSGSSRGRSCEGRGGFERRAAATRGCGHRPLR